MIGRSNRAKSWKPKVCGAFHTSMDTRKVLNTTSGISKLGSDRLGQFEGNDNDKVMMRDTTLTPVEDAVYEELGR